MLLRRRLPALLAATLLVTFLPACTPKKKKPVATPTAVATTAAAPVTASAEPSTTPSASPEATPEPTPSSALAPAPAAAAKPAARVAAPYTNPLTGGKEPLAPVVAAKVNNTYAGLPQSGLDQADVIYEELVEGGETRLCAIFSTNTPTLVGPLRSARETDIELLAQYGKITLAFSGANRLILGVVRRANLVDGRWDAVPSAYTELRGRHAPYRVHVSIPKLLARAKGADAKDIGLRFGSSHAPSSPAKTVTVHWQGATNTVKYNPSSRRWTVYLGTHRQVTVDNLVVQYVKIKQTGFTDVVGNHTPLARTLGSGKVTVFRDGRAVDGSWHRQFMQSPTVMLDTRHQKLLLRPGTTFVMLVPNTISAGVS